MSIALLGQSTPPLRFPTVSHPPCHALQISPPSALSQDRQPQNPFKTASEPRTSPLPARSRPRLRAVAPLDTPPVPRRHIIHVRIIARKDTYDIELSSRLVRMQHQFRTDFLIKLLRGQKAQRDRSLLQRRPLLVRLLRALGNICTGLLVIAQVLSEHDALS